jgi:hypothetical protein
MSVPVFVTYRDRYSMLTRCLRSLEKCGFDDITVIDNDSKTPLGLQDERVKIIRTDNQHRHLTPWAEQIVPTDGYYIVMDCDIELDCPTDVEHHLIKTLELQPMIPKVGLAIRSDDLLFPCPERYEKSYLYEFFVNAHQAYPRGKANYAGAPVVIAAPIDTHFAMYRPGGTWPGITGARLDYPYVCRHLPWYNPEYSIEEVLYYSRAGMKQWAIDHCAGSLT